MTINKLDNLFDRSLDYFYNFILEKKVFENLKKDINFVSFQGYILDIIKEFINKKYFDIIKEIIPDENNQRYVKEIIKRYCAYYIYLGIAYFYKSGRDLYITNIIETSKSQRDGNFTIDNFYNSENNAKLSTLFVELKNLLTILNLNSMNQMKIVLQNNSIKFEPTIKLVNLLGEDFIEDYFMIKNNFHNILKTFIFRLIYLEEEKNDINRILKEGEDMLAEHKYIEVVMSKETKLVDFTLIQKFLTTEQLRSGFAEEIYNYLEEYQKEKELEIKNSKQYVNYLFSEGILIPITEEILRFHKDNEKYDPEELTKEDSNLKIRDATKIKYIINKMNKVRNYHSKIYNKNPKLKLDAQKLFYKPLNHREVVLYNDNEELKIEKKLSESEKAQDLDLLTDLQNMREYSFVNYKDLSKDGFKFRPNDSVHSIRHTNIKFKNKHPESKIELRVGNELLDINIIGVAWNPAKLPLDCFKKKHLTPIEKKNGYEGLVSILKSTFDNREKKLYYWLFDLEHDKPQLNEYINLSSLNKKKSIFVLLSEIYKKYIDILKNKINKDLSKYKKLNFWDIDNFLRIYNREYIDLNFSPEIKKYIINRAFLKKIESVDTDKKEDKIKLDDRYKLPLLNIKKEKENIIYIDEEISEINDEMLNKVLPICHHYVKWRNTLRMKNRDEFSQEIFNFVKQYVKTDDRNNYICKSCGEMLNIRKYVFEGTYIAEQDTFLTTDMVTRQDLEKIPKYAKYRRSIKNIEKNLEKIAFQTNLNVYIGNVATIERKRKMIIKDVIDLLEIHSNYLKTLPKNRGQNYQKKYGIKEELSNLFFFELKDDIFLTSSEDTDYYKQIKYNNILVYLIFILISEINPGQILNLKEDKSCNYLIFKSIKNNLFGDLYLRIDQKNKIPILKVPVLCYLLFYFACVLTNNHYWLYKKEKNDKTISTAIIKSIIHTFVDLLNSLIEGNLLQKDKSYIYEIITSRILIKIDNLFKDEKLLDRIFEKFNERIKIDEKTGKKILSHNKINFISLIRNKLDNQNVKVNINNCESETSELEQKEKDVINYRFNALTYCPNGEFHKWEFTENDLVCSICGQKYSKINNEIKNDDIDYKSIRNQIKIKKYEKLLKEYCISGESHKIKDNICIKCKINPYTHNYTKEEILQFENNFKNNIEKSHMEFIEKTKQKIRQLEKQEEKAKKTIEKFHDRYEKKTNFKLTNYIIEFIEQLTNILGPKIKTNEGEIYIRDSYYFLDHDYLGNISSKGVKIFFKENKVLFEKKNDLFKKDVYYYKDRNKGVTVFYDAVNMQYLGYSEGSRVVKIKSFAILKEVLSVKEMLIRLGLSNKYYDTKKFYNENEIKNLENKDIKIILERLIRERADNLRQIIPKISSIIYRIKYSFIDKTIYKTKEKQIINKFINELKQFKTEDFEKNRKAFKHWRVIGYGTSLKELPHNIQFELNGDYINTEKLTALNNLDSYLIYFLVYNLSRLLEYNIKSPTINTIAFLFIKLIKYSYDIYSVDISNHKIRKFHYSTYNSVAFENENIRTVGSYQELVHSSEIDDKEMAEQDYDMQEEATSLDIDDYDDEDYSFMDYDENL